MKFLILILVLASISSCGIKSELDLITKKPGGKRLFYMIEENAKKRYSISNIDGNQYLDSFSQIYKNEEVNLLLDLIRTNFDTSKISVKEINESISQNEYSLFTKYMVKTYLVKYLVNQKKYTEALSLIKNNIQLISKFEQEFSYELGESYFWCARLYSIKFKEQSLAIKNYKNALKYSLLDSNHLIVGRIYTSLSIIYLDLDKDSVGVNYQIGHDYVNKAFQYYNKSNDGYRQSWNAARSLRINCFIKEKNYDSVRNELKLLEKAYQTDIITKNIYYTVLTDLIETFANNNYLEFYDSTLSKLKKELKEDCSNRYNFTIIYKAQCTIAKRNNNILEEKKLLENFLDFLENCTKSTNFDNENFGDNSKLKILTRLIEIENILSPNKFKNSFVLNKINLLDSEINKQKKLSYDIESWIDNQMKIEKLEDDILHEKLRMSTLYKWIFIWASVLFCIAFIIIYQLYKQKEKNVIALAESNSKLESSNRIIEENFHQLEVLNKRLQISNRDLESFAHTVAHDVKSPLASLNSYAFLLKNYGKDILNEKMSILIQKIESTSIDLTELITTLLNFYSFDKKLDDAHPVNLHDIISKATNNLAKEIEIKKAEIIIELSIETVNAHESLLLQIFLNLISNSLKYSKENLNPQIQISSKAYNEKFILVTYQDNGIGIDSKHHQKIFDLFYKIKDNNNVEGTGLGLATCKKIIDKYHGEIWIESELGQGVKFFFTLPI